MNFNKVLIGGRLTRDPELRYIPSGHAVATLSLAVNEKRKDKEDTALFVDVEVWEKQAENCVQYLKKGSPVFIEGRLKLQQWDDKQSGQKRSKISVTAFAVQFLSSGEKRESNEESPAGGDDGSEVPF